MNDIKELIDVIHKLYELIPSRENPTDCKVCGGFLDKGGIWHMDDCIYENTLTKLYNKKYD